ncbi:MAG: rRNA maturation RNase YbeY [Candidatus Infernicultor aquiphilus]|uniref:Endoribonuclease YbeY n=1 Tax=Candidatus Infernicultor aquiphilus TaxID=1805029 RepID=A0A1J5GPW2_9BACT|nr:rRNA maturation RNase YbeY [bacterium]OIP71602.1 MAG: rRNA maturation RNase YbeY [Candidatus Atribacteria bacterium CG2_30_33_13]PIU25391.1 MAG: rRNA maturation RNase YbeY [Candidatus Atribacteria bacterium CG08_land_8_20_14_0_20_33_29]PIW12036.1 MAG: rRNA maturation RNase YbeY [Candidatus Atribacteria bacterium CG17_big_fil_post_rev_8_21_14_2_50_34_11]PIX34721.1 MAG: rRNA maturation RNase YbeY [Candidatus Atribacteria bacterium CG_4_8_14_3_um_filter_34_18]PIY33173.1 MAG: rRNA maturation RN
MEILIKNQQKIAKIYRRRIREIIKNIIQYLKVDEKTEISILFTDDKFIKSLNKKYRGINKSTDVLTFNLEEGDLIFPEVDKNKLLGDIVVSVETAQRQANNLNHNLEKELAILLIHGLLHLIGYDHEEDRDNKIMQVKENEILDTFDL